MKIAVIHSFYRTNIPSGENFTVEMQTKALSEAGHDVRLIARRTDEDAQNLLHPIRSALNVATGGGGSPLEELQIFNPDIVHIHNLFPNISTNWLKRWNGPIVTTLHNFRPMCSNGLLFRDGKTCTLCPERGQHHALIHKCYRDSRMATLPLVISNRHGLINNPVISSSTRLIVLSERSRRTYISNGADSSKIVVVPNFISDTTANAPQEEQETAWLYAGRLTPEKGITQLLRQWPVDEQLEIAGSGPDAETIENLIRDQNNIKYLGGLPRNELLTKLSTVKGLIIPSLCAENLPTVYLEALAAGLPVIARRGNSAADDVSTWAPVMSYESTAELTQALHHAHSVRPELIRRSRAQFEAKYTERAWTMRIGNIYNDAQQEHSSISQT